MSALPLLSPSIGQHTDLASAQPVRLHSGSLLQLSVSAFSSIVFCTLLLWTSVATASAGPGAAADNKPLIQQLVSWWQKKIMPHERYAEKLLKASSKQPAAEQWLAAAEQALQKPFSLSTAHAELGRFNRNEVRADGYQVTVKQGQRLLVELSAADNFNGRLFVDLFKHNPPGVRQQTATNDGTPTLLPEYSLLAGKVIDNSKQRQIVQEHIPDYDGQWLLRLQPELLTSGRYKLRVTVAPLLGFPVQNASNSAARSFFGVDRDAGRRRHHGVDIFAPRHTPVLAVADGTVVRVSESPRGGLHVWLQDRQRFAAYYFAHLEATTVSRGQRVRRGEQLGTVGNSGNARTTPPHLHFGMYRSGPIDPWPYIRQTSALSPATNSQHRNAVGQQVAFNSRSSATLRLRAGPGTAFAIRDHLRSGSRVQVLAASSDWFKVRTDDGLLGWASANYLTPVARPEPEMSGEITTKNSG